MSDPGIRIELVDGSGCYVTWMHVDSLSEMEVVNAVGIAAATFVRYWVRDRENNGPWDPERWREKITMAEFG